jgi:serine/threonine protein kinase
MELGSPPAVLPRTRRRGSKRSEDSPSARESLRTLPQGPRSNNMQTPVHKSSTHTPGARSNLMFTPGPSSAQFNTPARSTQRSCDTPVRGNLTPSCHQLQQSGYRSVLVSPSTQPNSGTQPSQDPSSGKKSESKKEKDPGSPVSGRIHKVFRALPFSHNFNLKDRIGEGTFSTVYLATRKNQDIKIALKHLVPTSKPARIVMETGCMRAAAGHTNVIQLLGMWRVEGDIVLAMPYVNHSRFSDLIFVMDLEEIKNYVGNLLAAIRHIHNLGIIHRDIKPSNFLYDRTERKYALVDFGLAQYQSDLAPGNKDEGRGHKRTRTSEVEIGGSKRLRGTEEEERRGVLEDVASKLNRSPRVRILRDYKMLRRSPRKLNSPGEDERTTPGTPGTPGDSPRKRLKLQTTPKKIAPLFEDTPILRQSPRKHALTRPGYSKLTITGNSILGSCLTPSSSLTRTPSFTLIDPASHTASQLSQTTDTQGRTPLLRASITSAYGSSVPAPPKPEQSRLQVPCSCVGKPKVCSGCLSLPQMHAPRAGTPGFRPPEVLLKHPNQTTAIDIWAVGVIMVSILSRSYPFFRAPDDMTALAELAVVFGTQRVKDLAKKFGRSLLVSVESRPLELGLLCQDLSSREKREEMENAEKSHHVTEDGISVLNFLLELDHTQRITAASALDHPFFKTAKIN